MSCSGMAGASVRIVVAGDPKTGKSSLIRTFDTDAFPTDVIDVLPPTTLSENPSLDPVPVTLIDTSSSNNYKLVKELENAHAVVLTYACDRPETLDSLNTHWLPFLRLLEVKVPVIVVGCMVDRLNLENNTQHDLEHVISPIILMFREIETWIECSASKHIQVAEVFYYAQQAVLHPKSPVFDQETQTLRPVCARVLETIFRLSDLDGDGALSDEELKNFQVKCFNGPLQPAEIVDVKRAVQEKKPEGVNDDGLTLTGFLFLHTLFIEIGRLESLWTVLREFKYDKEILAEEQSPSGRHPDHSVVELTDKAMDFLKSIFGTFDKDGDGSLQVQEVQELFSKAPDNPWDKAPYRDAAETNASGGLTLNGFLSEWALMALLDRSHCVKNLIYIGYDEIPTSAIRVTQRRKIDRERQSSDQTIYHCFVFGPNGAGKTRMIDSFIGSPSLENYVRERYAANIVEQTKGIKKTLVLHEIPENEVEKALNALAACDVAVFVHDSSESSFKKATKLHLRVESTGYEIPSLIIGIPNSLGIQDSTTRVSEDMSIIFLKILTAAEHPHMSIMEILEIGAGKCRKKYHKSMLASGCRKTSLEVQGRPIKENTKRCQR